MRASALCMTTLDRCNAQRAPKPQALRRRDDGAGQGHEDRFGNQDASKLLKLLDEADAGEKQCPDGLDSRRGGRNAGPRGGVAWHTRTMRVGRRLPRAFSRRAQTVLIAEGLARAMECGGRCKTHLDRARRFPFSRALARRSNFAAIPIALARCYCDPAPPRRHGPAAAPLPARPSSS
jgi:hypothetical protein